MMLGTFLPGGPPLPQLLHEPPRPAGSDPPVPDVITGYVGTYDIDYYYPNTDTTQNASLTESFLPVYASNGTLVSSQARDDVTKILTNGTVSASDFTQWGDCVVADTEEQRWSQNNSTGSCEAWSVANEDACVSYFNLLPYATFSADCVSKIGRSGELWTFSIPDNVLEWCMNASEPIYFRQSIPTLDYTVTFYSWDGNDPSHELFDDHCEPPSS